MADEAGRTGTFEERDGCLMHPDPEVIHSHIAYFFIPLPEPLGLPDGHNVMCTAPTPDDRHNKQQVAGLPRLPREHVAASLTFHRVTSTRELGADTDDLFRVAHRAFPPPEGDDVPGAADTGCAGIDEPSEPDPPAVELTVAEMAVTFDQATDDDSVMTSLSDAFDRGLQFVREVQRAYYMVRRRPLRLAARESMPFAVPLGVRRLWDDDGEPLPLHAPLSLFWLNLNVPGGASDAEAAKKDAEAMAQALRQQSVRGFLAQYLEFVREAQVALDLDGAYRAAVLFTATACEVLLDNLLSHLLWEDRMRPEEAGPLFDSFLTTRVKSHYHDRLGGQWSVDKPGAVQRWSTDIAGLRNRVVHVGYEPSMEEARAAAEAAAELATYLGDLLARRTSRYPRTALVLPGEHGLRRRHAWNGRVQDLREDPDQVDWDETYARWRAAMQQARTVGFRSRPDPSTAHVYAVVRTGGDVQWVLHDRHAHLAAVVDRAELRGPLSGVEEHLEHVKATIRRGGAPGAISVAFDGVTAVRPLPQAWLPEYRLVPMSGVMVDGDDLDALPGAAG